MSPRDGQAIAPVNAGCVVVKADSGYMGQLLNSVDVSYTVRGLVFDGDYANRTALEGQQSAALASITGGTNVTFDGDTFQYGPAYGLWMWRSSSPQILNNRFVEIYMPVQVDGNNLAGGTVRGNTMTNTAAYHSLQSLQAVNTTGLNVTGNTISGAGLGVPVAHGHEGTWGNGIYIFNSGGYVVENNMIGVSYWSAIVVGQHSTGAMVRGNHLNNGQHTTQAVWIEQVGNQYNTLDNNDITGGVSMGDSGGDYLTITNNRIITPGVGFDVNSACKHATFDGNIVTSSQSVRTNNGFYLWKKSTPDVNIQITNNTISGFNIGVAADNGGGIGSIYGIHLSGNVFYKNNLNTWAGTAASAPWGPGDQTPVVPR